MERIKDSQVIRQIELIGSHYQENISNRFLRPLILQLQIDKNTWDQIELLTEKMELFRYQGFHLDELYRQIAACARFVEVARNQLIPNLRGKLNSVQGGPDKILRDMAANNFVSNLQVFTDRLNDLYTTLVEIDKQNTGANRKPVYTTVQELYSVDHVLVG